MNNPPSTLPAVLDAHAEALAAFRRDTTPVEAIAERVVEALRSGGNILVCGNGGSAAQADHFVGELVGRFQTERRGLPAVALAASPGNLTSIGNDYGFESVFARQVEALGRAGDVLVALTTSGSSANVVRTAEKARERGLGVVGLTGGRGEPLAGLCEVCWIAPGATTARIQEMHLIAIHAICEHVDAAFK